MRAHYSSPHAAGLSELVVVLALLAVATSPCVASPALSPDQERRRDAGEIVLLDVLPPGASESAQGGTAVALVCAAPAAVWAILVDWPNHPRLYPRVRRAEVLRSEASRVRVRYTLAIGLFSFDAVMDKDPDPARRRMTWRLAEDAPSTFFAESSGYWQVDAAGAGSVVTHAVATRTLAPGFLVRGAQRDSLVATVQALRARAQKTAEPCTKSGR